MKVSVIVPVFNAERTLSVCLDSICSQTLREFEVLCVDDGSTDGSAAMLRDYVARDARIRVLTQVNAGSGVARNRALDAARGEAVVFMDPDDYYPDADVLAKMVAALEASGMDLVGGVMRRVPESDPRAVRYNDRYRQGMGFPHLGRVVLAEYQSPFRYTCFIYRKAFLDGHAIRFPVWRRFQDPTFLARAFVAAGAFWATDIPVYCYRLPPKDGGVDWLAQDAVRLRDFARGFDETLDVAEQAGCRLMYVETARALARARRFDGVRTRNDVRWGILRRLVRRLRERGWLGNEDWWLILKRIWAKPLNFRQFPQTLFLLGAPLTLRICLYRLRCKCRLAGFRQKCSQ